MKNVLKKIYLNLRKFVLYTFSYLFSIEKIFAENDEKPVRTVLFIRIDRIGDLVLSTPAIKAVKKAYPKSKLIILASKANQAIAENNPYVNEILIYNKKKGIKNFIKVIKKLRKFEFDLAIDPYAGYELKTALIAFLSGSSKRLGIASYGREFFLSNCIPQIPKCRHFIDLTIDVLKPLKINTIEKYPEIHISEEELEWSECWIRSKINSDKPVIAIHPGAYYETQRWPVENYAELVNILSKDQLYEIIIFGGPGDQKLINQIDSLTEDKVVSFCHGNIRKFISLLFYCNILICSNSGPLHIAVATKTATISFMGPTLKERWFPRGFNHWVLRKDNLPCIGCNSGRCRIKTHECMRSIKAAMVAKIVKIKMKEDTIRKKTVQQMRQL